MAVYPDQIVLKSTVDTDANVRAAIGPGGSDEIVPGELVIRSYDGITSLYTINDQGDVTEIAVSGNGTQAQLPGVFSINDRNGVLELYGYHLRDFEYNGDPEWSNVIFSYPSYGTPGEVADTPGIPGPASIIGIATVTETLNATFSDMRGPYYATSVHIDNGYILTQAWANAMPTTGPWQLEMWVKFTDFSTRQVLYSVQYDPGIPPFMQWYIESNQMRVKYVSNSIEQNQNLSTSSVSIGKWYHVILNRRSDNTWRMAYRAIDASFYSSTSWTDSGTLNGVIDYHAVWGAQQNLGSLNYLSNFYVSDIRLTKASRYTGSSSSPLPSDAYLNHGVQAVNNDLLQYNGTTKKWNQKTPAQVFNSIDIAGDVTITAVATNDVLLYSTGQWRNTQLDIDKLSDVSIATPVNNQVLKYNGSQWANGFIAIDTLSDVDTSTTAPAVDQALIWNGSSWVPGQAIAAGNGSIAGTVRKLSETRTAVSGAATFTGIGKSGLFVTVESDLDAWIVFYPSAAARSADSSRLFGVDPSPGSGVLAEYYIDGPDTIITTPGASYFNGDTVPTDAIYAAVRTNAGVNVDAEITVTAYVRESFGGVGSYRVTDSGLSSGGDLTLVGIGSSGILATVQTASTAWVCIYGSAADRSADTRSYGDPIVPGDGVLADLTTSAGSPVLATPSIVYFNNDINPQEAIYFKVRTVGGVNLATTLTVTAYAETTYTGVSGGIYGSG